MSKELSRQIDSLHPWFHNIHLPDGTQTAPQHFLGDFPRFKWEKIKSDVPEDLRGWKVLDIGCNAGFYSIELAKRGAEVLGIDVDPLYLKQAEWVAEQFDFKDRLSFKQMQVYDLAYLDEEFDLVWYMGVLYHLRYPLLSLDILSRKVKRMMFFQTLTMPGKEVMQTPKDIGLHGRSVMQEKGWPKMAFIEKRLNGDMTNWWAPNHACIEAMLHSCGFEITAYPDEECYIVKPFEGDEEHQQNWNQSEYLSATGQNWKKAVEKKVNRKNHVV